MSLISSNTCSGNWQKDPALCLSGPTLSGKWRPGTQSLLEGLKAFQTSRFLSGEERERPAGRSERDPPRYQHDRRVCTLTEEVLEEDLAGMRTLHFVQGPREGACI